jgi:myosin V
MSENTHVYVLHQHDVDTEPLWYPAILINATNEVAECKLQTDNTSLLKDDQTNFPQNDYNQTDTITIDLNKYPNNTLPLQNVDPSSGEPLVLPNLINLPYLHPPGILYNLIKRHQAEQPYTSVGEIILAMNPYKWLPIYTESIRNSINESHIFSPTPPLTNSDHPPHVYLVSASSYRSLLTTGRNQSILVSGESGAGKTETVKILMEHLAGVHDPQVVPSSQTNGGGVVSRVLESNPVMEAFGNAKTVRNDNSSRFGKYTQLQFNTPTLKGKDMKLEGSKCDVYLLEKSRVCGSDIGERGYHVFYQLLSSDEAYKSEVWGGLTGKDGGDFDYIGLDGWGDTIEGKSDGDKFKRTRMAMETLGITRDTQIDIFRTVSAVMQCGNVHFEAGSVSGDAEGSSVSNLSAVSLLCDVTGFEEGALVEALTHRKMKARDDEYMVPLTKQQAEEGRDAFSKSLYDALFRGLVERINQATEAKEIGKGEPKKKKGGGKEMGKVRYVKEGR